MALIEAQLPLESLIPTQVSVDGRRFVLPHFTPPFRPVKAVVFKPRDGQLTYFLLDGHHRAKWTELHGESHLDAFVALDDAGVASLARGTFSLLRAVSDVQARYHAAWQPMLEAAGVTDIASLPVDGAPLAEAIY